MKIKILLFSMFCFCAISLFAQNTITTGTLLEELINRDALPEFPDPYFANKQFSSYDRDMKTPDTYSWFANEDRNQFIRTEENEGRKEYVMYDAKKPGAIVRFWVTLARQNPNGILRIYLDNEKTPAIQGNITSIVSGKFLIDSPLATYTRGGNNLYLPIPYASSCKITYQTDKIENIGDVNAVQGEVLYYNIGYREYGDNVKIQTFSLNDLKTYSDLLDKVKTKLTDSAYDMPANTVVRNAEPKTLKPNSNIMVSLSGAQAVRKIEIKLSAGDIQQALRSTILRISFDNKEKVWVPLGDFFGIGYVDLKANTMTTFKTWYTEVDKDGTFICYWVMPYKKSCQVTIENIGDQNVDISKLEVTGAPWKWTKNSMYFGAGWFEKYMIPTKLPLANGKLRDYDLNHVTLNGQGILAGTSVSLFSTSHYSGWWGEGDEKIYIDNEKFPSTVGTGSEDYYGYAWGGNTTFQHPFFALTVGLKKEQGLTSMLRYYSLDKVTFQKKFQFDMEISHWHYCKINYAPVSIYYMKEGGTSNLTAQTKSAQNPVTINNPNTILPDNHLKNDGVIEFEDMSITRSDGYSASNTFGDLDWSNYTQTTFIVTSPGAIAEFTFLSDYEGTFNTKIGLTKGEKYSIVRLYFNDEVCLDKYDCYNDTLKTEVLDLGMLKLKKGNNTVKVEIIGRNPAATTDDWFSGFDFLKFDLSK